MLIHPGLGSSGEEHWQTRWEKQFPQFIRIEQHDWDTPIQDDWISALDNEVQKHNLQNVILVGHSLACATIAFWASERNRKIRGALLVGPSDTEAKTYPPGTSGFTAMRLNKLPFPSITIASSNDFYVTLERAKFFSDSWGSRFVNIGEAGHINVASGFGNRDEGLNWLKVIDED